MILGIDASNIRAGGGVTHLVELLRASITTDFEWDKVIIWSGESTLNKIEERDWLEKVYEPLLSRSLPFRLFWQRFRLKQHAVRLGCDVLFVPGGSDSSGFTPVVSMSQNLLPFDLHEILRYGFSLYVVKFFLLRLSQTRTFRKSDGVIFLTKYARESVLNVTGKLLGRNTIIPHGVNPRFLLTPRPQRQPNEFTPSAPCRVLYVSIVSPYKHQWHVAKAVAELRSSGIPVVLDLIGPPALGMTRLKRVLNAVDPREEFISYKGAIPYETLNKYYTSADIGVFASSCENMPNILLENMAAGLPIACSSKGPMPEILGEDGVYFDPENSESIAAALRKLIISSELRERLANKAFKHAQEFTWEKCAKSTLNFLASFASKG